MRTKQIDIIHHFLRYTVEYKNIDINYIRCEENPADVTTKNTSEEYFVKHMKRITEVELWDIVENGT